MKLEAFEEIVAGAGILVCVTCGGKATWFVARRCCPHAAFLCEEHHAAVRAKVERILARASNPYCVPCGEHWRKGCTYPEVHTEAQL